MAMGSRTPADDSLDRTAWELSSVKASLLAHELRGVLTVIAGYTDLLRLGLPANERIKALDGIDRALYRADSLCGDMLSGRDPELAVETGRTRIALPELVEHVVSEQRMITDRIIRIDAPRALHLTGDERTLSRMLSNLVGNATKYSPSDEPVDVRVSMSEAGLCAVIEVLDRGPGIPQADRSLVFEPFERLSRDADTPGTGLGLTVVRQVVLAHGGEVDVSDRNEGGTVVRVTLPVNRE